MFKDKPVNCDPREVWVRKFFAQRGEYNAKVSRNVHCVNIDAVISVLVLKIL